MSKLLFCFVLCFFTYFNLLSQNQKKLDSLQNIYNTTNDTFKIYVLLQIASTYLQTKPDTAFLLLNNGIKKAEKIKFSWAISYAKHHIGLFYHYQSKFDSALKYYEEGLKIREENKDKSGLVTSLNNIAVIYQTQGNFVLALEKYERCVIILKELQNKSAVGTIKNNMASIYMNMGNYSLSLATHLECLKIREELNDKDGLLSSYINIGNVYKAQDETDLALQYYIKGLEFEKTIKNKLNLSALLNNIGMIYKDKGKLDLAMDFYQKALVLKEEVKDKKGMASAYINIGGIYERKDSIAKALIYFDKALLVQEEIKDKQGKQLSYNGITVCYIKLNNYDKALSFANLALQIAMELKTPKEIKEAMIQLYRIYKLKNDFGTALDYFEKAKNINDSLFSIEKSKAVSNLESRYNLDKKEKEFAILQRDKEISDQAGKLNELEAESKQRQLEILEKQAEADQLVAMARLEKDKRKADSLMNLAEKAQLEADNLQIVKEKQDLAHEAELAEQKRVQYMYMGVAGMFLTVLLLIAIGFRQKQKANKLLATQKEEVESQRDLLNQKNEEINRSYQNLEMLSDIGKEITSKLAIVQVNQTVYDNVNRLMPAECFGIGIYNKQYNRIDFIGFMENGKTLPTHYDELADKNSLSNICFLAQKEIFTNDISTLLREYYPEIPDVAEVGEKVNSAIFLPLIYKGKSIGIMTVQSYRLAAYSNYHFNLLKNIAINATIALTNSDYVRELDLQKELINKNHVNTLSSINAAKRIQDAILPMADEMQAKIANFFIFYLPRDIVSGDFYWFFEVSRSFNFDNFHQIFVVGDCTGHGVPGAFMSMIGNNLLNDIVKVRQIVSPDLILNELRLGVHKALQQDKTGSKEGMDIVVFAIEKNKRDKRFLFAGAMNPLFYVKNNEFFEIKGDKMAIGGTINEKLYQLHEIHATHEEEITFWLTTDGYQDQFGGKENKKFMVKRLKNLLFENVNLSLAEQKVLLQNTFEDWKGEDEQIDDVTILGLRF